MIIKMSVILIPYSSKLNVICNLPGDELSKLAIVGEEPLCGDVIAECNIDEVVWDEG